MLCRTDVIGSNISNIIRLFLVFWKLHSKSTWLRNLRNGLDTSEINTIILQIRNFLWYLRFWGGMQKNSDRENVLELSWLFKYTFIIVPREHIQANQSLNQSILSPLPAIPSILWPAMFKEHLIHVFTQFKDKIQCIHTLRAFEWGDLVFHTGLTFWSGSLSIMSACIEKPSKLF